MKLKCNHELFQAQVEVIEELGITIEDEAVVKAVAWDYGREIPHANDHIEVQNQYLVVQFIQGTNAQNKGSLQHIQNSFWVGEDLYPTTVHEVNNILH